MAPFPNSKINKKQISWDGTTIIIASDFPETLKLEED